MEIKKIMVIGAGMMGAGIAEVTAQAGYQVILNDMNSEAVELGLERVKKDLEKSVKKERISADQKDLILDRIALSTSLEDGKEADFIIEAVYENPELKKEIFNTLDGICSAEVIFASNTSSIPISTLAAGVSRQDRFIGMHFFSPVPVMKLVEVIKGIKTSEETIKATEELVSQLQKESVRVKDVPGFLVNRINNALRNEAFACMEEGVASIEDIDKALKMGLRHPMGPFELMDFTGLDLGVNVAKTLYEGYKDVKWRPNMTLEKLVISGDLGRKSGKGWYDYTTGEKKPRTDIKF